MNGPRDDQSEVCQTEKDKFHTDITYMWSLKYDAMNIPTKQKERHRHRKQTCDCQGGGGGEGLGVRD